MDSSFKITCFAQLTAVQWMGAVHLFTGRYDMSPQGHFLMHWSFEMALMRPGCCTQEGESEGTLGNACRSPEIRECCCGERAGGLTEAAGSRMGGVEEERQGGAARSEGGGSGWPQATDSFGRAQRASKRRRRCDTLRVPTIDRRRRVLIAARSPGPHHARSARVCVRARVWCVCARAHE